MLERKYTHRLESFLREEPNKILLVNGARQIGKSYLIRYVASGMFKNYVEINLKEDKEGDAVFADVKSTHDFYVRLSAFAGNQLGDKSDTIIFLDEIQAYPHLLMMLKFLNSDGRYRYIASGSQLGVALSQTPSVPLGSIAVDEMYPLDFEEFLWANGVGKTSIDAMRNAFLKRVPLNDSLHEYMLKIFKYYLLVGGMPDAVNHYIRDLNIMKIREVQRDIMNLYKVDASQYDKEKKLLIRRIYDLIPSNLENKKKRVVYRDIEDKKGKRFENYIDEFEYLTNSGVALEVRAISNPTFPLRESESKNLLKLYLNDVGLLTMQLYNNNINAVLRNEKSINLGTVYESVVAQELHAHGHSMYYYDNKKNGEVDYLVDDYETLKALPIEVKSGKDYTVHSALDKFLKNPDYNITEAIVLSNEQNVYVKKGITYMPVYYVMFIQKSGLVGNTELLPKIDFPE